MLQAFPPPLKRRKTATVARLLLTPRAAPQPRLPAELLDYIAVIVCEDADARYWPVASLANTCKHLRAAVLHAHFRACTTGVLSQAHARQLRGLPAICAHITSVADPDGEYMRR
jgi:hypothetical protein